MRGRNEGRPCRANLRTITGKEEPNARGGGCDKTSPLLNHCVANTGTNTFRCDKLSRKLWCQCGKRMKREDKWDLAEKKVQMVE